jgi:hypothetical protein
MFFEINTGIFLIQYRVSVGSITIKFSSLLEHRTNFPKNSISFLSLLFASVLEVRAVLAYGTGGARPATPNTATFAA